MYVTDPVASVVRPGKQLKGFEKIALAPGETRTVRFRLTTRDLEFHTPRGDRVWEPGRFVIGVGPNSDTLQNLTVHWRRQTAVPPNKKA
jgi:beta-glucosidase